MDLICFSEASITPGFLQSLYGKAYGSFPRQYPLGCRIHQHLPGIATQPLLDSLKCRRLAGSLTLHSRADHPTRIGDSATLLPAFFNAINASTLSPWGL